MPVYTYRRADGTTFDVKQKFTDEPLTVDPETGQAVTRLIQSAGIVFKGTGFYVNDSKGSKANLSGNPKSTTEGAPAANSTTAEASAPAAKTETPSASTTAASAAD